MAFALARLNKNLTIMTKVLQHGIIDLQHINTVQAGLGILSIIANPLHACVTVRVRQHQPTKVPKYDHCRPPPSPPTL